MRVDLKLLTYDCKKKYVRILFVFAMSNDIHVQNHSPIETQQNK